MRLTKTDPTGTCWYLADGVSPASPVFCDNHTSFTPGISERGALGSRFYLADAQGNTKGMLDGGGANIDGYNWDAFGNLDGTDPTAYAWGEGSGYQTDQDGGLRLLGYRYYDSRTGRFISQDPAGDGDNWYAYCGNDPVDNTDPEGLWVPVPGEWSPNSGSMMDAASALGQVQSDSLSLYSTYASTVNLYLNQYTSYDNWQSSQLTGQWLIAPWMLGGGGAFAASRQDLKTLRKLAEEAGYGLNRIGDGHPIYTKPGKDLVELPGSGHSSNKDHRVVENLKKRLQKEILENQQEDVNSTKPSATESFWASRTDGQLSNRAKITRYFAFG